MRGIAKRFPGVIALGGVSFDVRAGEVHALVGENGAGKSTLMKILAGAQPADEGQILLDGAVSAIANPAGAERLGIGMVYQEFNLVPELDAVENIVLGREPLRGGLLDASAARAEVAAVFAELGVELPARIPVRRLSVAQRQLIEIAKVLARRARIIVMDEPTAALSDRETDALFNVIAKLKARGVAIVYISHRLEELPRIADRITVLRDGRNVETREATEMPERDLVRLMVGREMEAHYPALPPVAAEARAVLEVAGLTRAPAIVDVSFAARAGEIVGLAGLVGAGRSEIVRAIAGADVPQTGTIRIDGRIVRVAGPADAIAGGIALVTDDRKAQGLVLDMSVRENVTLAHLAGYSKGAFVDRAAEDAIAHKMIDDLQIRTPSAQQRARNLSGGNQQKVVLAKWLAGTARAYLFDEPTRGIDVGAKFEIYELMIALAKAGAAIVMVSSDMPELLGMSHRVLVVRGGRIVAELNRAEATSERVLAAATGAAAA
jgi:ribose transport system ATP-binding protein